LKKPKFVFGIFWSFFLGENSKFLLRIKETIAKNSKPQNWKKKNLRKNILFGTHICNIFYVLNLHLTICEKKNMHTQDVIDY
jgi:hypothetical protein